MTSKPLCFGNNPPVESPNGWFPVRTPRGTRTSRMSPRTRRCRPTRRSVSTSTRGVGEGVPFYVRAGKRLKMTRAGREVRVEVQAPPPVVFKELAPAAGNYLRFPLEPSGCDRARGAE